MLRLEGVSLSIGGRPLFAPLTLTVSPGDVTAVMGPSGSGKSSLLSLIAGLLDPALTASGTVRIGQEPILDLPPEARGIGLLFQDDLLFPHLSVRDNLLFGVPPGLPAAERRSLVREALEEAELAGFEDRDPATLSGGQRTRVALMRTLLSRPRALLLDEPFSRLDHALRDRIRRFVFDHATRRGLPVLLVTHDPDDADAAGGTRIDLAAV
ncbi:ATP-binding cassette domain-containing protein [Thalassobaculum litoreum]|uniref:Putative thiamine transport system ATP-binding protein n=1 Tax=Thalassobaculum litoreum DSM 18839 TaxID=1123362 RepID=A0A8G2BJ94_9PROT|nr:ATP-binding cassette domain-containing protein [Thalassobaculum litoreum]SDF94071.1 putative thiamine transport system ATP-binding protein [Thalassobaculum litoreum DSM 18839]